MNNNFKIWLCGMTANKKDELERTTAPIAKYFDGLVWVDHFSDDGTFELLDENKGDGKIIQAPWTYQHDVSMNMFLYGGPVKTGDWIILKDSIEYINEDFAKNIKDFCNELNGSVSIAVASSKAFIVKFMEGMFFLGSPHWGLKGVGGPSIDVHKDIGEKETIWRPKDGEEFGRPFDNEINHHARYIWEYARSNHHLLGNEGDIKLVNYLEQNRIYLKSYFREKTGQENTLNNLKEYLKTESWKSDKLFIQMLNTQKYLLNFYRYRVLGHSFEEIKKEENTWKINM